ncbi:hypothetical protein ACQEXU_11365 [Vibrio sp. TRT 21S02]|uniref:hypothetical protein n=1 Tax=Vibrio sp. TRT 21S02 TaxID=3418507 RepID=UPI003CF36A31
MTLSYYPAGVGTSFGYNPESGKGWIEFQIGFGMGGHIGFDPNDNGRDKCGSYGGVRAQWDLKVGGVGVGGKTESDGLNVDDSEENNLFDPDLSTDVMGINELSISAGAGVFLFGGIVF